MAGVSPRLAPSSALVDWIVAVNVPPAPIWKSTVPLSDSVLDDTMSKVPERALAGNTTATSATTALVVGAIALVKIACVAPAVCGNGQVETGEACDDGNEVDGDDCTNACQANTPPP